MSLAHLKEEFMSLSYEEQDRITEMFQAIRLTRNKSFVKKQKAVLESDRWVSLDDIQKDLDL